MTILSMKKSDFKSFFYESKTYKTNLFIAKYKLLEGSNNKVGFIIKKSNIKSAVQRNTYRRIIRESFRINYNIFSYYHIVIFVKLNLINKQELHKCLLTFWNFLSLK
jgi:ribonuclease P protein component